MDKQEDRPSILESIENLVKESPPFSKTELTMAIAILKRGVYRYHGPCVICREGDIAYHHTSAHAQYGEGWLRKFFNKLIDPHINWERWPSITINGYRINLITGYSCGNCRNIISQEVQSINESIKQEQQQKRLEYIEMRTVYTKRLLGPKSSSAFPYRFHVIGEYLDATSIARLQSMPYREFLDTLYWDQVRKYKLYQSKYRCDLCGSTGQLDVHHKTYEHRGSEYLHLDDLTVLCRHCHAKFHDKLPSTNAQQVIYHA